MCSGLYLSSFASDSDNLLKDATHVRNPSYEIKYDLVQTTI